MAKIMQTTNSYEIEDTTIILDGAVQIDDFSAGLGIVAVDAAKQLTQVTMADAQIVVSAAGVATAVTVSGDINIDNTGATTAQPALISGKTATATADDADIILLLDATDNALKQQTRANFLAGAAGTPAGLDSQVQYNDGGAFGADAAFTTDKAGGVTVNNLVVGNNATAIDAAAGNATIFGSLGANTLTVGGATTTTVFPGSLTVEGTTTFIDSTNLRVEDKVIDLNSDAAGVGVGSNIASGLNILSNNGANTVTFLTLSDGGALSSSSGLDVATGKVYSVNGTEVLSGTTLGSGVVNSSLTSVGTIATGVWQGTEVGVAYGGTGQTSYTDGQLLIGNSTGNTLAKATLTAGAGISVTNGSGAITIATTGGSSVVTETDPYVAGVTSSFDITIPTGNRDTVGFFAQILLEDTVTANTGYLQVSGVVTRSTGAPLLPEFIFVITPGNDALNVSLATGGANTLRFTITTPAGSGDAVTTVSFCED